MYIFGKCEESSPEIKWARAHGNMALAAAEQAYVMRVDGHSAGTMQKLSTMWEGGGGGGRPALLVFLRHFA